MFINKFEVVFFPKSEKMLFIFFIYMNFLYFFFTRQFFLSHISYFSLFKTSPPFWLLVLNNLLQPCHCAHLWGVLSHPLTKRGEEAMMVGEIFKFIMFILQENAFSYTIKFQCLLIDLRVLIGSYSKFC